ncbi:MAG: hypothetical protein JRI52_10840 [Deltaproteobacteria bacterium]|nr:hypothetical protein [Deltaproteobacteria bacterium]
MDQSSCAEYRETRVIVNPGVCGFSCTIHAGKIGKGRVAVSILDSCCEQVQKMSQLLEEISLEDLFKPLSRNPVLLWAKQARCHTTCIVPLAVLKAVEVEMGMAVPRDAGIKFK